MKQKVYVTLLTPGLVLLVALFTIVNCGKPREMSGPQVADQLLRLINKQLPGSNFQVKPDNCIVESIGNNLYRVTFKDFTFNTDWPAAINRLGKIMAKDMSNPKIRAAQVEEAVMIYDTDKNLFQAQYLKNMRFDYEMPELPGDDRKLKLEGSKVKKFHGNIGKITFSDLDIVDIDEKHKSIPKKIPGKTGNLYLGAINPAQTSIENLKFGMTLITKQKDLISVFLEIEKMGDAKSAYEDPGAFMYIFDKDAPPPDLNRTLKKGWAVFDTNIRIDRVNISIEKNGSTWGNGGFNNISYSLFIKPDDTYKRFKFGYTFELKDLKLSIPGKKEIQLLANINEFRNEFAIKNLTEDAALAFLTLIRKLYLLRDQDQSSIQEIMFQALQFQAEMYKSKALLKLSISPFKHFFGEMEAKVDMRLHSLLTVPETQISVTLFKINETLKKVKEANLLSPGALKNISVTLEKYTVKQENGDACMNIELNPAHPGKFFLNGKPRKFRTSTSPQYRLF